MHRNEKRLSDETVPQEFEDRYRLFFQQSNNGMGVISPGSIILDANTAMASMFGCTVDELTGCKITDFFVNPHTCVQNGHNELSLKRKDGSTFPALVSENVISLQDGNLTLITVTDVTNYKRNEPIVSKNTGNYVRAIENTTLPVIVLGLDRAFKYANQAAVKLFGYNDTQDFSTIPSQSRYSTESLQYIEEWWKRANNGYLDFLSEYTYEIITYSGEHKLVKIFNKPIFWDSEEAQELIYQDVTEQARDEEHYRFSVDNSPICIHIYTNDGKLVFINKAGLALRGINSIEEFVNTPPEKRMTEESFRKRIEWEHARMSGIPTPSQYRFDIVRPDGDIRNLECFRSSVYWNGSIHEQVISIDVTERVEAEELFKTVANNSPVGIYIIQHGKFVYVNPQFMKDTGYTREELFNKSPFDLVVAEERGSVRQKAIAMIKNRTKIPYEYRTISKNGEIRWSREMVAPIVFRGDRATIGSYQDITENKKMEENLLVTDRLVSVGELAAGIAHELNNPLTSVIGFSELLIGRRDVPDDIQNDLKTINNEAFRASQVARHLLTFARQHNAEKSLVQVNTIIKNTLSLRSYEQKVNNITVTEDLAEDLPRVYGNDFQLQQVFLNIIINAEYFMIATNGRGLLEIKTELIDENVRITFKNDGPGIPLENLNRLFNPFFTTKEVGKGTGLGLSISYGIITEHGGRISAENNEDKGVSFIIELPTFVSLKMRNKLK